MGLPVIVSSRCGAAEVIQSGVNGWICRPDDPLGLAKLMREADASLHGEGMGRAARASAERFGLDAMAQKHKVSLRIGAYILAVGRVAEVYKLRGTYA